MVPASLRPGIREAVLLWGSAKSSASVSFFRSANAEFFSVVLFAQVGMDSGTRFSARDSDVT